MLLRIGGPPDHDFDEPLGLLSDCHRRIEHFLAVLVALEQTTGCATLTAAEQSQLAGAIRYFATAAPRHTADEEESLFPRLRRSDDPGVRRSLELVGRLEHDHERADRHHHAVEALARRWQADGRLGPDDASALRGHLAALQEIYREHIQLEDRELFPAAARVLSAADIAAIGQEMAARRR